MDNPVVMRAAEVVREAGHATLRFNFRGVGASTGSHDKGAGEQDDVRAARGGPGRAPARRQPGRGDRLFLRGLRPPPAPCGRETRRSASSRPRSECSTSSFRPPRPAACCVVAGTRDTYCPVDALHQLARTTGAEEQVIEGADHFFFGKLYPLGEAIRAWVAGVPPAR